MINLNKNKKIFLFIFLCLILIGSGFYYLYNNNNDFIEQSNILEDVEEENKSTLESNKIIVHICGAVNNEGIVELEENARLVDAINKAGGLRGDAYTDEINLADILEDGEKIYIRTKDEYESSKIQESESNSNIKINESSSIATNDKKTKININTATQEELETLPGIGESTALKIINYRKENGKFKDIEAVKGVKGIGESKFENIKDLISI